MISSSNDNRTSPRRVLYSRAESGFADAPHQRGTHVSMSLYVSNVPWPVTGQMLVPTEARSAEATSSARHFGGWRRVDRAVRGRSA